MYLYLERDQHRARHTPDFPLPSWSCLHPRLLLSLLGRKGDCSGQAGGKAWEGGNKFLFLNPRVSFA